MVELSIRHISSKISRKRIRWTKMAELTRTWTTDRDQIKPPYLIMKDINLVLLLNPNHHCCLFWRRMGKGGGPSWASGRIGVSTRIIGRWDGAGWGL